MAYSGLRTGSVVGIFLVLVLSVAAPASGFSPAASGIDVVTGGVVPVANFTATPLSGPAPLTVQFSDLSAGSPTRWSWSFGDENYTGPWTKMGTAAWSARYCHTSVALPDGTIVMMGGIDSDGLKNDTWRSSDEGATWTLANASSGWTARYLPSSVALPDNSIVLIGGRDNDYRNDVWRSTDEGATWTLINASAGWSPRCMVNSLVMPDGSMLVIGGSLSTGPVNDVWRSADGGVTWTRMTSNAGWTPREMPGVTVMPGGEIILTGGTDTGAYNQYKDVWRSADSGVSWTEVTADAGWTQRFGQLLFPMPDGSIIMVGGYSYEHGPYRSDIWRSLDEGATWTELGNSAWSGRMYFSGVMVPDGTIVVMGGQDNGGWEHDVWRMPAAGSSLQNPVHTYPSPGTYNVSLKVSSPAGNTRLTRSGYISVLSSDSFTLPLSPGWNFVSVPKRLESGNNTAAIFSSIDTDSHSIWQYDTSAHRWVTLTTGTRVNVLDGIWIYSKNAGQVPLHFSRDPLDTPPTKDCFQGWNAIGFSDTAPMDARSALLSVHDSWTTLIGYNAEVQKYETAIISGGPGTHSDDREMQPGKGYWLYMTKENDLAAIGA